MLGQGAHYAACNGTIQSSPLCRIKYPRPLHVSHAMNLFQSIAMLVVGLVINLGTVYCMHKSNELKTMWSWYFVGVATTIVLTQMCIMLASRSEKLPLDVAIAIFIAFIMLGSALLLKTIDSTRIISGWEWFFYALAILGALGVGIARQLQS